MIGETTASNPDLEVSVSFGRFENDSLSWEKWSAFSPNKYLEEVEKCATPGSVAQKKAYFEAHYKKIAARKAELLEQERLAQSESNERDLISNGCLNHVEIDVNGDQSSDEGFKHDEIDIGPNRGDPKGEALISDDCKDLVVETESNIDTSIVGDDNEITSLKLERESENDISVISDGECKSLVVEKETEIDTSVISDECETLVVEMESEIDRSVIIDECQSLVVEKEENIDTRVVGTDESQSLVFEREEEIEFDSTVVSDKISKSENNVTAEVEIVSILSKPEKEVGEAPVRVESQSVRDSKTKKQTVKLDSKKESQKVTSAIKDRNVVSKPKKKPISPKKPISSSPITRTPKGSIQRVTNLRPNSASSRISISSESSAKKANNSQSLSRNKTPTSSSTSREAKKFTPKPVHMSLSFGHANSNSPSLPTNRKSLIMERMGDKDIVKRAFKAFQNNFNQVRSYGDESPLGKQVPISSKGTEQKVSTSTITPRKENGGLRKIDHLDKRSTKIPPASFGLKSFERDDKRKELTKKTDPKSDLTNIEKTPIQTRPKEAKEADSKKLRESLNFKATPMPAFYRGQKVSKSALDKIPAKTVTGR